MTKEEVLNQIKKYQKEYKEAVEKYDPDQYYLKYLGKKGIINQLLSEIKDVQQENKIAIATAINLLKKDIQTHYETLANQEEKNSNKNIDMSIPVKASDIGQLHPTTRVIRDLNNFFHYYGFSVYDGPEIEDDFHNFEMMGVPPDHPARELQDTLYILEPEFLLRTQTSSIEARELKRQEPPIRFVFGGKAFRNETANKSNSSIFNQYQGVCVDKNINMGHLKWIFEKSLKHILGEDTVIRFRAKYYPEVEPGMSPDIMCTFCKGSGCDICKHRGWIEIAGGGMIHPKTLEYADINPKEYSGFAFGWGLDRIVMAKYKIKDIRLLYNGSIVYT